VIQSEAIRTDQYEAIRSLVHRKAGIALGATKQALVQARLAKRLRVLDLSTYDEYLDYLAGDGSDEEIVQLLDAISTNFTSFFREEKHFELLGRIVRDACRTGTHRFRLWCAAASTGEEPYTLSMVVQESGPSLTDLRILATDISTRVLHACHEGAYETKKLEGVPDALRRRWWGQEGERMVASEPLRKPLTFARLNLAQVPYVMTGPFDVIFCRNVMIYFDADGRRKFVDEARRLLAPGGHLFVGSSESLAGIADGFSSVMPSVYRKGRP